MEKHIRVLLAEDNELVRETIVDGTHVQQYLFTQVKNGAEAMSAMGSNSFDVIILDVGLPGLMNGLDVLQKARELRLDLPPVIVMTGYPKKVHKERAERLGAVAYLTKTPLNVDELVAAITKALASYT
jgi:DNA-binding response OmpR family regulator